MFFRKKGSVPDVPGIDTNDIEFDGATNNEELFENENINDNYGF